MTDNTKKMFQMKVIAKKLFDNTDWAWFDSPTNDMAIGVDWDCNNSIIIDLDHPDGACIQTMGDFYPITVYTDEDSICAECGNGSDDMRDNLCKDCDAQAHAEQFDEEEED